MRGHKSERQGALPARGCEEEGGQAKHCKEHHEGKRGEANCDHGRGEKASGDAFHDGRYEDKQDENVEAVDLLFLPLDDSDASDPTHGEADKSGAREDRKQFKSECQWGECERRSDEGIGEQGRRKG